MYFLSCILRRNSWLWMFFTWSGIYSRKYCDSCATLALVCLRFTSFANFAFSASIILMMESLVAAAVFCSIYSWRYYPACRLSLFGYAALRFTSGDWVILSFSWEDSGILSFGSGVDIWGANALLAVVMGDPLKLLYSSISRLLSSHYSFVSSNSFSALYIDMLISGLMLWFNLFSLIVSSVPL